MTVALYKEFTLRDANIWQAIVALVKANAPTFAERGEPLRVIITSEERKRNAEQNRFYWGVILRDIAEQAWVGAAQFDKDVWHEFFARKFGVCEDVTLPDGETIVRRKSTTNMSVHEFSEYMTKVQAHAAAELGVEFS